MFVIVVAKLVGVLRDIILANYYGTTNISDAYLIASSVPTLLFYFIGHALSTAYIPMYNKAKAEQGAEKAQRFSNNLLNTALLASVCIALVLCLFPQAVIKVFAAGFDGPTAQLAARLIRISCPSILLMAIVNVWSGYLQANKSFLAPAAISLPRNFAVVLSIIVAAKLGTDWLGAGLLGAYILETAFLLPFVYRKQYRYGLILNLRDVYMQQTMYMVMPIFLGVCVGQINKIVDRSMASTIAEGGISALTYASIINNAIQEVLVTGLITILFASCAELVARNEIPQVKKKLSDTIAVAGTLLIPGSVGVFLLAEPIVELILCRGEFNRHSLDMTVSALRCYTAGLLFLAMRDTLVKVFYAFQETKITTAASIASICLNIVLNVVLGRTIGIEGLAMATSLSIGFNCVILWTYLRRKIGDFGRTKIFRVMWKSGAGSVVMGLMAHYGYPLLAKNHSGLTALFLTIMGSCVIYAGTQVLLANEAVMAVVAGQQRKNEKQSD